MKNNNKGLLKKISMIVWVLALSLVVVNATIIDGAISSFTGTLEVKPVDASIGLTIDQNYDNIGLNVDYDGSGSASAVVIQRNAGTGDGLFINQDGNGIGIKMDSEATDASPIYISSAHNGAYSGFQFVQDAGATGRGITLQMASTGGTGLYLQNAGTGNGLFIDQNGDGSALGIDNAGNKNAVNIIQTGVLASDASGLQIYSSALQTTSVRGLFRINQNNAGSSQDSAEIINDGTGNGLLIDQNGAGTALVIDIATADNGLEIVSADPTSGLTFTDSAGSCYFYKSSGNACVTGTEVSEDNGIALCWDCT